MSNQEETRSVRQSREEASRQSRRHERHQLAQKLYSVELDLSVIFGTVNNLNDCNLASEQIETLLDVVRELKESYEHE